MAVAPDAAGATRDRVLLGLAAAIADKGFAATTIADIARQARVSKRTFYEVFAGKEAAFLALYETASDGVIAAVQEAATEVEGDWRGLVRRAVLTFFSVLQAQPALTRAHFLEIYSLGEQGLAARRRVLDRYAEAMRPLLARRLPERLAEQALRPAQLTALVGGISELALRAVEEGRADRLIELGDEAVDFVLRLIPEVDAS